MKKIVFLMLMLMSTVAFSQNKFLEVFGDTSRGSFNKIKNSSDGGFLISGNNEVTSNYFIKTDSLGNVVFCKIIEIITLFDFIETDSGYTLLAKDNFDYMVLRLDLSGNLINTFAINLPAGGTFQNIVYYEPYYYFAGYERYFYGMFIIKCDTSGTISWCRNFFNSAFQNTGDYVFTTNQSFYCVGEKFDSSMMMRKLFAVKIDSSGNVIWGKTFNLNSFIPGACLNNLTGGLLIYNTINSNSTYVPIVLSLDSNGIVIWNKTYYDSLHKIIFRDVESTSNDGFIFGGQTYQSNAAQHILLSRIDNSGNILWAKQYYGASPSFDFGTSVCHTVDNGFAIVGITSGFISYTNTMGFIIKTDSAGELDCYQQPLSLSTSSLQFTEDTLNLSLGTFSVSTSSMSMPAISDDAGTFICGPNSNVTEMKEISASFYPTPVSNTATLRLENDENHKFNFKVYNILGKIVLDKSISENETELNFSNFCEGIYVYKLHNANSIFSGIFTVIH